MTSEPSPLAIEEFRALRATIRERGTARVIVTALTFLSWGVLVLAVPAFLSVPVLGLVPLLVLAAGFEVVFATHVGVERIGRFLQARYEAGSGALPGWEHAAMQVGRAGGHAGIDPIFSGLFTAATMINLVPIALLSLADSPMIAGIFPLELTVYGLLHAVFIIRIVAARRYAAAQRDRDLALFSADV